jgi:hypothetical protein
MVTERSFYGVVEGGGEVGDVVRRRRRRRWWRRMLKMTVLFLPLSFSFSFPSLFSLLLLALSSSHQSSP